MLNDLKTRKYFRQILPSVDYSNLHNFFFYSLHKLFNFTLELLKRTTDNVSVSEPFYGLLERLLMLALPSLLCLHLYKQHLSRADYDKVTDTCEYSAAFHMHGLYGIPATTIGNGEANKIRICKPYPLYAGRLYLFLYVSRLVPSALQFFQFLVFHIRKHLIFPLP